MQKLRATKSKQKPPGRVRRFVQRTALATGLALAGLFGAIRPAQAEEAKPAPTQVRPYPNFSGGGVHGNPAIWPQYGNWGYLEFGRNSDGKNLAWLMLSSRLAGDVHGLASVNTAMDSEAQTLGATGALALPVAAGFYAGASAGLDSDGATTGRAGLAHVLLRERLILRSGADFDLLANVFRGGAEVRFLVGLWELTGSGNAKIVIDGSDSEYAGQTIGGQARYGDHLVSFGAGGNAIGSWLDFTTHYRWFVADQTLLDLFLSGRGVGLFRSPAYAGVGVTRLW